MPTLEVAVEDTLMLGLEMVSRTLGLNTLRWSTLCRGFWLASWWSVFASRRHMLAHERRTESGRELGRRNDNTDNKRCLFDISYDRSSLSLQPQIRINIGLSPVSTTRVNGPS